MEFSEAMEIMEKGMTVRRPSWTGYLFLDIDENIKHAGNKSAEEEFWIMDIYNNDWEEYMTVELKKENEKFKTSYNKEEIMISRMEALMDQNSSHLKRFYYLEDMIESHHKSVTRLVDSMTEQMNETKKKLSEMVNFCSSIQETVKTSLSECGLIRKQLLGNKMMQENITYIDTNVKKLLEFNKDKDNGKLKPKDKPKRKKKDS